jgi:hypothetical protein
MRMNAVLIHVYICRYIFVYWVHKYVCKHAYVCIYICIDAWIFIYICIFIHINKLLHTYVDVTITTIDICSYIYMYIYIYTCIYNIHIFIYTHISTYIPLSYYHYCRSNFQSINRNPTSTYRIFQYSALNFSQPS